MADLICPECVQGKHHNCDGNADMLDDGTMLGCICTNDHHIPQLVETLHPMLSIFPEDPAFADPPKPENDPGILAEAFPEVTGDEVGSIRLAPNREVIRSLYDVEVLNPKGQWVPMIPYPLTSFLGVNRCLCGKYRLGKRYQEHYAYAHILGMED